MHIAGCSVDTLEAQEAFARKNAVRFPLIADESGDIARSFDVYREDWKVASRATAVIDENGLVVKTYPKASLDGKGHAEEVYRDIEALFS